MEEGKCLIWMKRIKHPLELYSSPKSPPEDEAFSVEGGGGRCHGLYYSSPAATAAAPPPRFRTYEVAENIEPKLPAFPRTAQVGGGRWWW
ncbi:hypothetical protein Nepgr_020901 [Nepenthes gracilis]|uniref:Uncharacterized protein n=1 Tax=Nepenthes gracilis TaxID=150966 RepID=A0AAD3SXP6_NEPGR|nr:hypothetical protein Nepgr_020901 [Nepenthes gracilis]